MTSFSRCRAKNPSLCAYHGHTNHYQISTAKETAARIVEAKAQISKARNFDELIEAQEAVQYLKRRYDATLQGQKELAMKLSEGTKYPAVLTVEHQFELRHRMTMAEKYREEAEKNSPSLMESKRIFDIMKNEAEQSFTNFDSTEARDQMCSKLENLPLGTPIAVKLKNGAYLYDGAGNGFNSGKAPTFWERTFIGKGSFIQTGEAKTWSHSSISLAHNTVRLYVSDISEIHVLKEKTKSTWMEKVTNPSLTPAGPSSSETRRVIKGDGFYYEFEGKPVDGSDNEWRSISISSFTDIFFKPAGNFSSYLVK